MSLENRITFDRNDLINNALPPFDLVAAREWLAQDVHWPSGTSLENVRMSRVWVGLPGRIWFELELSLNQDGQVATYPLQGAFIHRPRERRLSHDPQFTQHGLMGLQVLSKKLNVWCCTPDKDRKFRVVHELLDPQAMRDFLSQTKAADELGLDRSGVTLHAQVVAYRSSKRCVLRVTATHADDTRQVFLKTFKRARTQQEIETLDKLKADLENRSDGTITLPATIDNLPDERLHIIAAVPQPSKRLRANAEDLTAAANVLTTLHASKLDVTNRHKAESEFELACRRVSELQLLSLPYERLVDLLGGIAQAIEAVDDKYETLIHGAYHTAQVLRARDRLWILDLDTLSLGHPEADLAKFIARLLYKGLSAGQDFQTAKESSMLFLEKYREGHGMYSQERMRFYLPCSMARHGAAALSGGDAIESVERYWHCADQYLKGEWSLD